MNLNPLDIRFIPNAHRIFSYVSTQAMAASIALLSSLEVLPDDIKAELPYHLIIRVTVGVLIVGIVGRSLTTADKLPPAAPPTQGT